MEKLFEMIHTYLEEGGIVLEEERQKEADNGIQNILVDSFINGFVSAAQKNETMIPFYFDSIIICYWAYYHKMTDFIDFIVSHEEHFNIRLLLLIFDEDFANFLKDKENLNSFFKYAKDLNKIDQKFSYQERAAEIKMLKDFLGIINRNPDICKQSNSEKYYNLLTFETLSVFPRVIEDNTLISSERSMLEEMTETQKEVVSYYCFNEEELKKIKMLIEHHMDDERLDLLEPYTLKNFKPDQILLLTKEQLYMIYRLRGARVLDDIKEELTKDLTFCCPEEITYVGIINFLSKAKLLGKLSQLSEKGISKMIKYVENHPKIRTNWCFYEDVPSYSHQMNQLISIIKKDLNKNNRPKILQKKNSEI